MSLRSKYACVLFYVIVSFFALTLAFLFVFFILPIGYCSAEDFVITKSCGGGFAAIHHVLTINQDGVISRKVIAYVKKWMSKKDEIIGHISREDAKRLYSQLMQIDFNNISYSKPREMSCKLSLAVNGREHSVVWSENSHPEEIRPVLAIFNEISRIQKEVEENKTNDRDKTNKK